MILLADGQRALADLATLWRASIDDVQAIFSDPLQEAMQAGLDASAVRVQWADAVGASTVYSIYRPIDVEGALGDDFERVRSSRWRTIPVQVHLPRFIVDRLTRIPFIPSNESVSARAERLLCEVVEAECVLESMRRNPSS